MSRNSFMRRDTRGGPYADLERTVRVEAPRSEECAECGETYPFPISYHHSSDECYENTRAQMRRTHAFGALLVAVLVVAVVCGFALIARAG